MVKKSTANNVNIKADKCRNPSCKNPNIKAGQDFLVCSKCNAQFHKQLKCSGHTRKQIERLVRATWECEGCQGLFSDPTPEAPSKPAQFKTGKSVQTKLTILQWNCDAVLSKVVELREFLSDNHIDIFALQETKLIASDKFPNIKGYTVLRRDRPVRKGHEKDRGGGLIIGVKENIPFRKTTIDIRTKDDKITEALSVKIPTSNNQKLRITNIYSPPIRNSARESRKEVFDLEKWPSEKYDMIIGDINAHSSLWDLSCEKSDKRGEALEKWLRNKMVCLNDGRATHIQRATGKGSTPDASIVHSSLLDKTTWNVVHELNSDHKPILITFEDRLPKIKFDPSYKWRLDKAKWEKYTAQIEEAIPNPDSYQELDTNQMEKTLRNTIIKAAHDNIGKKKLTANAKCWFTDEIKAAISTRNSLGENIGGNRKEWIESCQKVAEMIKEEKKKRWIEYVETIDSKTNPKEIWNTIRNLDGRRSPPNKNEVLEVDGIAYTENKQKAHQFAKTYKGFGKIPVWKYDRALRKENWKGMKRATSEIQEIEEEFTLTDLNRTIKELKPGKAAGKDTIPNEFIQNLGVKAREMLLNIYNRIWNGEDIPYEWLKAVIRPLLKDGKEPKYTTSWRPISLIACLGKVMEKLVADRLLHWMEKQNKISPNQAGFRPNWCTTDQALKLVQSATDQFHHKGENNRTFAAFFDYAKAYDKVWRDGLISKMLKLSIPGRFIRFTRQFLANRHTQVEINGERSDGFFLKQGLPQGSAISPLLFLIFINDIDIELDVKTQVSLFADDTAEWLRDGKKRGDNTPLMQSEINKILEWAAKWKMVVNTDKTNLMVISTSSADRAWDPKLQAGDDMIEPVSSVKFLGITIDNQLRMTKHVDNIVAKARKRVQILQCLSTKDWGNSVETQRRLCLAYVCSVLEYGSASFNSWITKTTREKLQKVLNQALRAITNLCKSCPVDFLHLEASIEPLKDRLNKIDDIQWDKYARLPPEDPRQQLQIHEFPERTSRPLTTRLGWRTLTSQRMNEINITRDVTTPPLPPWWTQDNVTFKEVPLSKPKAEYTVQELQEVTQDMLDELNHDIMVYTDGSTDANQENGGAGVFVTDVNGETILEASYAAGRLCSSYTGECVAALRALEWIERNEYLDCAIVTDSMSLHAALRANNWKDRDPWLKQIKEVLHRIPTQVCFVWIPSHIDIDGNERADQLANAGTSLAQNDIPVTHNIVKAKIKSRKWVIKHERASLVYGNRRGPKYEIESKWPRNVRRTFQQLRTGHSPLLLKYQYLIDKIDDATCGCELEDETIEHVLCRCPILSVQRWQHFGGEVSISMMVTDPEKCRRFLQIRFQELKLKTLSAEDNVVRNGSTGSPPRWRA